MPIAAAVAEFHQKKSISHEQIHVLREEVLKIYNQQVSSFSYERRKGFTYEETCKRLISFANNFRELIIKRISDRENTIRYCY